MMPETKMQTSRYGSDADLGDSGGGASGSAPRRQFRAVRTGGMVHGSAGSLTSPEESDMMSAQSTHTQVLAGDKFSREYMYAYYRIPYTYVALAQRIALLSTNEDTHVSDVTVRQVMRDMSRANIVSQQYRWDEANGRPTVDERRPRVRLPALVYAADCVFVALAAMVDADPLNDAIKHCQSVYMPDESKYVTLQPLDADNPHVLATRTMRAADGRRHAIIDYARQVTAASVFGYASLGRRVGRDRPTLTSGARRINADYDELSRRERCRALFIDFEHDEEACSFAPYERAAREPIVDRAERRRLGLSAAHVLAITCDYPRGIVELDAAAADSQLFDTVQDVEAPATAQELAARSKRRRTDDSSDAPTAPSAATLTADDVAMRPREARTSSGVVSALATGYVRDAPTRASAQQPVHKKRRGPVIIKRRKENAAR